jgi:hypothetical protein
MKKTIFIFWSSFISFKNIFSQTVDPWKIKADKIDPSNYYGVTVANGMIGIVSSPEPFKVKDVVLAGAYDLYGRGRVSNFLRSFNLLNMYLEVDKNGSIQDLFPIFSRARYEACQFYFPFLTMVIRQVFLTPITPYAIYPLPF